MIKVQQKKTTTTKQVAEGKPETTADLKKELLIGYLVPFYAYRILRP
jgi:hypothetical protein